MMKPLNIVIVGVGGQGTLLASRILGALALEMDMEVKVSEVHGMSQRGGSVITYVRMGKDIASPLVEVGCADFVLAFEQLEALRALPYLKTGGTLITNTQKTSPMPVITGAAAYPPEILEKLAAGCPLVALDALGLAHEAGEARAVNLVLLGVMCALLKGDREVWERAIRACVPERFIEVNLRAFESGLSTTLSK